MKAISTDWWMFWATIFAGVLAASSTILAVIYTNKKTIEHIKKQEDQLREEFKRNNLVIITPVIVKKTFLGIVKDLIDNNITERCLLFPEDYGLYVFDDLIKFCENKNRMLRISNDKDIEISSIKLTTKSILTNMNTQEKIEYSTENYVKCLRKKEKIFIKLQNQEQFEKIIEMNRSNISSNFEYTCEIEYSTLANQRVYYIFEINIENDYFELSTQNHKHTITIINKDEYTIHNQFDKIDEKKFKPICYIDLQHLPEIRYETKCIN